MSMLRLIKLLTVIAVMLSVGTVFLATRSAAGSGTDNLAQRDDARALAAFNAALPVFKHPRCLNCHSNGDFPRQGDDGHVHAQNVKRGVDGKGKFGQKCAACHQDSNVAGLNMPPGAPNWHLPPAATPMIWEGKTGGQICRQLKDPKQNGGKTVAQIVEHVTSDKLVLWGWAPGDGRTPPAMPHSDFAAKVAEWAKFGAVCPE